MNMPKVKKATYYSDFRTTLCQINHSFISQTTTKIQLSETKSRKTLWLPWITVTYVRSCAHGPKFLTNEARHKSKAGQTFYPSTWRHRASIAPGFNRNISKTYKEECYLRDLIKQEDAISSLEDAAKRSFSVHYIHRLAKILILQNR